MAELATALNGGQVQTLVILGGNPAYNAPADLNWPQAQAKAKTVIRLGYYEDETSWDADLARGHAMGLAAAHFLESWGDARTADGTIVPIQPLIEPLFGGIDGIGSAGRDRRRCTQQPLRNCARNVSAASAATTKTIGGNFCTTVFWPDSAAAPGHRAVRSGAALGRALWTNSRPPAATPTKDSLDVVFYRDAKVDDGRHNNNGWLQELPDPDHQIDVGQRRFAQSRRRRRTWEFITERNSQNQKFFNYTVEITLEWPHRARAGVDSARHGGQHGRAGPGLWTRKDRTRRARARVSTPTRCAPATALYYASGATLQDTGDKSYELADHPEPLEHGRPAR